MRKIHWKVFLGFRNHAASGPEGVDIKTNVIEESKDDWLVISASQSGKPVADAVPKSGFYYVPLF